MNLKKNKFVIYLPPTVRLRYHLIYQENVFFSVR